MEARTQRSAQGTICHCIEDYTLHILYSCVLQARTDEERRKLEKLSKERGEPQLWTAGFKFYVGVTVVAGAALTALCIFAAYQGASLAGYDPFAVCMNCTVRQQQCTTELTPDCDLFLADLGCV